MSGIMHIVSEDKTFYLKAERRRTPCAFCTHPPFDLAAPSEVKIGYQKQDPNAARRLDHLHLPARQWRRPRQAKVKDAVRSSSQPLEIGPAAGSWRSRPGRRFAERSAL